MRRLFVFLAILFITIPTFVQQAAAQTAGPPPGAASVPGQSAERQEVPSLRTRTSRTYIEHGHYATQIYPAAINFRDQNGSWQPIDDTLVPSQTPGYSKENRANSYSVKFPDDIGARPVRIESNGEWLEFSPRGAQTTLAVSGTTATYSANGYSLTFDAGNEVLKENIQLDGPGSPHDFVYNLRTSPGLTASEGKGGRIDFANRQGKTVFSFATPYMYDSSGAVASLSNALTQTLAADGNETTVTLTADESWLNQSGRVWPVTIDPTTLGYPILNAGYSPDISCPLVGQYPDTSYCTTQYLWAGYYNGSYRSPLHFNVSNIPRDAEVLNAELGLYLYTTQWSQASTTTVNLDPMTRGGWTMAATWNTYDGTNYWTTPGGDYTSSPAASTTISLGASGWTYWNPQNLVQGWINGSIANNGMMLAASTGSATNLVEFYSSQSPAPQQDWPYLLVQYSLRTGEQSFDTMVGFDLSDSMDLGVNVTNGNLLLHESDVSMDGVGFPLTIDHYYNSLAPYSDPEFVGDGWSLDAGSPAQIVSLGDVGAMDLIGPNGYQIPFTRNADGSYSAPPAIDATLTSSGSYLFLTFNRSRDKYTFWNDGIGNYYVIAYQNPSKDGILLRHQTLSQGTYEQITEITDTQNRNTPFTYNSSGDVSLIQDPSGRVYSYAYDAPGNHLVSYSDPSGGVTAFSYSTVSGANSAYDVLVQITDPSGEVTKIGYTPDSYGIPRVASVTQTTPGTPCASPGCTTTFTYNSFGHTTVTDPNGHAAVYTYDALGRVTAVKDAFGQTWQTSWTADSHPQTERTAGGHVTAYSYDALNNLTQVSLPTGPTIHWTYGNPTWIHQPSSFTDEENRTTSFGYDSVGRLNTVTDPLGHSSTTIYNANGTPASDTDANGHVTSYSYYASGTSIGLLSQVTPPAPLGAETITYDSANRTSTDTDGKGQKGQYSYDPLDRVTGISFSKSDSSLDSSLGYAYDADGNTLAMTDSTGTTNYTYDALGELLSETLPTGVHLADGHSVEYAYDPAGNLLSKTDGSGKTAYAYRQDDLVSSATDPLGAKTTFAYDSDDNPQTVRYPIHVFEEMLHDSSGQLTRIFAMNDANTSSVITLNSYTYSYTNPATLQATATRYSMTDLSGNKTAYTYDAASELTQATQTNSAGTQLHSYVYGYDPVGNMTSSTIDGSQTTMTFNAADELAQESGASSMALQYDANGNQTNTEGATALTYNAQDQTTSMTAGGAVMNMTYTGGGQARRTVNGPTGSAASYQYDMTGMGSSTTGGAATYYTTGPDGELISERIPVGATGCASSTSGYCTYYYLYDGLGSVVGLAATNGTVQDSYSYDPEGNLTNPNQQQPIANIFGYGGAVFDGKTGLYAMGERYYNPKVGRFTQLDPLGGGYGYADNNPINETDPSGLCGFGEFDAPEACPGFEVEAAEEGAAGEGLAWENQVAGDTSACSFSAGTSVSTPSGEVPIASLQPGDQVLAYNQSTGTTGSYTVQASWQHQDPTVESVTINGDTLTTTPEHPFDTKEKGWVPAGKLWKGAHVRDEQGGYGVVQKIAYSHHAAVMYNLTVSSAHTYYVGAGRWLVHNACNSGLPEATSNSKTKNRWKNFGSERAARRAAKKIAGRNLIKVKKGVWRSRNGRWQYRATSRDVSKRHVHIERVDPRTNKVLVNWHFFW